MRTITYSRTWIFWNKFPSVAEVLLAAWSVVTYSSPECVGNIPKGKVANVVEEYPLASLGHPGPLPLSLSVFVSGWTILQNVMPRQM